MHDTSPVAPLHASSPNIPVHFALVSPIALVATSTHVAPRSAGVNVTYTLEQQQLVHEPETDFKEQWLDDILTAKRLLFHTGASVLGDEDPLGR